jgi:hypothetical protein
MTQNKIEKIAELIRSSALFAAESERLTWIEKILPQLDEADLAQVEKVLLEAAAAQKEFEVKRVADLKQKHAELQEAISKVKKMVREGKEQKEDEKENQEIEKIGEEIAIA